MAVAPLTTKPWADRDCQHDKLIAATLNSGGNAGGFRTEPGEHLIPSDTVQTLGCDQTPAIAFAMRGRGDGQECELSGDQSNALRSSPGSVYSSGVVMSSAVRRLTPRECERLQGFPDDWTLVPYRGKPMADGPRYKMLGNSMAVPVMRWIGERILRVQAILYKCFVLRIPLEVEPIASTNRD